MTCVLDSCNQGREPCADPAVCCGRSRRVSEADMLAQAAASGQMDARQQYEHERAGELAIAADPIGVECALPIHYVGPEPKPARWTVGEVALVGAVAWLCGSLVYLRVWG